MKKLHPVLLCTLFMLVLPALSALGQFNYTFRAGSGQGFEMGAANIIWDGAAQAGSGRGGYDDEVVPGLPIGFTFKFDGVDFTTFSVSTNGLIGLGNGVTSDWANSLTGSNSYPILAPFWNDLRVSGGVQGCGRPNVSYQTFGQAPARVLVVEYHQVDVSSFFPAWGTFQVRLYETSNSIEFYYAKMATCEECGQGFGCTNTSASIGIASDPSRFVSVTPLGGSAVASMEEPNDGIDLNENPIEDNSLYVFVPCNIEIYGLTGPTNGGTLNAADGDTFFNNVNVQINNSETFRPFWTRMSDVLCTGTLMMSISGPAASDYYFNDTEGQDRLAVLDNGALDTTLITFRPTATGLRSATLTVTDGAGFTRTFNLAAYSPNVVYTGILPQGGTAAMATGDTLFKGMSVPRFGSQSFTPFMLTNVSGESLPITYTLNDPTGQYSIDPTSENLEAEGSTTPTITFNPTRFGPQKATLTVDANGEVRTFTLLAISAAPGGDFVTGTTVIDSNSTFFTNTYTCAGEQGASIPVTIRNTGYGDFVINSAEFYQIDTTYGQGRPRYPFVRDAQGNLVPTYDYVLTTQPNVLPNASNTLTYPIIVPEGTSRTVYLTFVSQRPEKRFARVFFRTNGQSSAAADTDGVVKEGIMSFEVYGRGNGARLSDNTTGGLPKPVVFPETHVGQTSEAKLVIFNPGVCPLRISLPSLNIVEGDVDEFTITKVPSANIDATTGDLVIAPGMSETIELSFHPRQQGSRRAGLRLKTNDSSVQIPGLTERGTYYLDLFGPGKADVYAEDVDFGQALIGGTGTDLVHKMVRLKNTLNGPIIIAKILIEGDDAGEFTQDGGTSWPTLPYVLNGGQEINLGVVFGPVAGGQPGARRTTLKLVTISGDTIYATLTGEAGTRTIAVTPTTANFGPVSVGKVVRRSIMITNNGTMPVTLTTPMLSLGSDFTISTLPRLTLEPTQVEYLEVTYAPQTSGGSSATLTIGSNASGGAVQVNLNGTATKTKPVVNDPSQTTTGGNSGQFSASEDLSVSGVGSEELVNGMALFQSVPNPARDQVEIGYRIAKAGEVRLELYDASGRLVKVLESGYRGVGEQRVRVNVSDLASGVYHYRLTAGGQSLSRSMNVVR